MINDPPLFEHYLFENPWPLCVALVIIALAVTFIQRGRLNKRSIIITSVLFALAAGVYTTATLVTTSREELADVLQEFARRAEQDNIAELRTMFDDNAVLTDENGKVIIRPGTLFDSMEATVGTYDLVDHTIKDAKAELRGKDGARSWVRVSTKVNTDSSTHPTEWLLTWRRVDDQWKVTEMQWLKYRGMDPPTGLLLRR